MEMTPIKILPNQKITVTLHPTKEGVPDTAAIITWASSDQSVEVVPLPEHTELDAEGNEVIIPAGQAATWQTPLDRGSSTVSMSSPGYKTVTCLFSYAPPVEGELNPSVGVPVSDE
jgi:hypothetical protein